MTPLDLSFAIGRDAAEAAEFVTFIGQGARLLHGQPDGTWQAARVALVDFFKNHEGPKWGRSPGGAGSFQHKFETNTRSRRQNDKSFSSHSGAHSIWPFAFAARHQQGARTSVTVPLRDGRLNFANSPTVGRASGLGRSRRRLVGDGADHFKVDLVGDGFVDLNHHAVSRYRSSRPFRPHARPLRWPLIQSCQDHMLGPAIYAVSGG